MNDKKTLWEGWFKPQFFVMWCLVTPKVIKKLDKGT